MLLEFDGPRTQERLARVHTADGALPTPRQAPDNPDGSGGDHHG
jgi:hypothetical protein